MRHATPALTRRTRAKRVSLTVNAPSGWVGTKEEVAMNNSTCAYCGKPATDGSSAGPVCKEHYGVGE